MRKAILAAIALLSAPCGSAEAATTFFVTGVAANDTLNLRAAPDAKSAKVGTLPHDATDIAIVAVGTSGVDWVKISKGNVSGWVNARFLSYDTGAPVRLTCQGTEPFWSVALGYGMASFVLNGEKQATLALNDPDVPGARRSPWLYPIRGQAQSFLLVDKTGKCSDGMSDKVYAYSMLVKTRDAFVEGCCN